MKKLFTLLALIFFSTNPLTAQKVKYKKDQVSIDDKPYCLMTAKGFIEKDYTVKTLEGKTVATMKLQRIGDDSNKPAESYYLISFIESGNQCEFNAQILNPGGKFAEDIVEAGLFEGGTYNSEGEKRFLKLHKRKYSEEIDVKLNGKTPIIKVENQSSDKANDGDEKLAVAKYKLVERNREGAIEVWANKEIKQDFKQIGYFTENRDGMTIELNFYLPDGKKIAKAIVQDDFAKAAKLTTFSDDKVRTADIEGATAFDWAKSLSSYLIERDYL